MLLLLILLLLLLLLLLLPLLTLNNHRYLDRMAPLCDGIAHKHGDPVIPSGGYVWETDSRTTRTIPSRRFPPVR